MRYQKEYIKNSDVDRLAADISNDIYAASSLLESLEYAGRILGSGHHLRQELALYASELLKRNFKLTRG